MAVRARTEHDEIDVVNRRRNQPLRLDAEPRRSRLGSPDNCPIRASWFSDREDDNRRNQVVDAVTSRIAIDNSNVRKFKFYPTEQFRLAQSRFRLSGKPSWLERDVLCRNRWQISKRRRRKSPGTAWRAGNFGSGDSLKNWRRDAIRPISVTVDAPAEFVRPLAGLAKQTWYIAVGESAERSRAKLKQTENEVNRFAFDLHLDPEKLRNGNATRKLIEHGWKYLT